MDDKLKLCPQKIEKSNFGMLRMQQMKESTQCMAKRKMTREEAIEHLIRIGYLQPQKKQIWYCLASIYPNWGG